MSVAFAALLILFIFGSALNIYATTTALIGVCFLLLIQVLTWEDLNSKKDVWDSSEWFSSLIIMTTSFARLRFIWWLLDSIESFISGISWYCVFRGWKDGFVLSILYLVVFSTTCQRHMRSSIE